jgi:hypothetical protein
MRTHHFGFIVVFTLLVLCSAVVGADEPSQPEPAKVAAVATDSPVTPMSPPAQDVAREVLRLQEELGGSITKDFGELPPQAPSQPVPPQYHPHRVQGQRSPVATLREVVWQLEQSAHLLELLDLYDQADALRNTANRLRLDARAMKAQSTVTNSE